ncbi:MAG: hypothetical protein EOM12_03390 [Verrucomicrobiae bacterium]|nr:hypothetical protein [Verrucomicrobiae bacterium]
MTLKGKFYTADPKKWDRKIYDTPVEERYSREKYERYLKRKKREQVLRERRKSLLMPYDHPFDRCPGKDFKFVKECEAQGDFSHSGSPRNHICEVCRCKNIAGSKTDHHGTGLCRTCEKMTSKTVCRLMNEKHERTLRQRSVGLPAEEIMKTTAIELIKEEEIEAVSLAAAKAGTSLNDFVNMITHGKTADPEVVEKLDGILEALNAQSEDMTPDLETAIMYIEDLREYISAPTEYVSGRLRIMSDKTRMSMAASMLKSMSAVGWGELRKQGMVPAVAIYRFLDAVTKVTEKIAVEEFGEKADAFRARWKDKMKEHILSLRGSATR